MIEDFYMDSVAARDKESQWRSLVIPNLTFHHPSYCMVFLVGLTPNRVSGSPHPVPYRVFGFTCMVRNGN